MNETEWSEYIFDDYKLRLSWTGRMGEFNKYTMQYQFLNPQGVILFEGDDYFPSPMHDPWGVESAAELLGFLTLKPGDTDDEYFEKYTPEQMEFAQSNDAEYLGLYALDDIELFVDDDGMVTFDWWEEEL